MRKLYLIGIGAGNPEYITVQAIKALNIVDVFFFMDKGEAKQELLNLRKEICERYIEDRSYRVVEVDDPVRDPTISDYTTRVELWHRQRALIYEEMIARELEEDQCGAFLVWGDPSLYDSTLRIIEHIAAGGRLSFEFEIIPGITSIQALAARHKITLNGIGESVVITTGRQLSAGMSGAAERTIVMLDGQCSFNNLLDEELDIFWGAYLGMEEEILLSGKLSEIASMIETVRHEKRQENGWIMDTYLLCRPTGVAQARLSRSGNSDDDNDL
ncbi:precorrin-6A synthase (deacetylating) [Granulicella sp. S156]|jgi:precorrin-6A synthase|uniref:precorrin-6A synthase (deacetylating) n=1 Tax=Granulicella sp. S156 TaxID=1747224 RepID=UPI00131AC25F|nr:precorrin-6A synthase (deacetylating) [Granulicella sp. S156]